MPKLSRDPAALVYSPIARRRGFALIGVLWLIALMGVLALSLLTLMQKDSQAAHAALEEAQAEGWADAGFFAMLNAMTSTDAAAARIPIDGSPRRLLIENHSVIVAVQDESGKIDLNFAPLSLISSLLATAKMPGADADIAAITDAIQAKRAVAMKAGGAGNQAGAARGFDSIAFHTIEELQKIPGIDGDIFTRLKPALTIYSHQANVQPKAAPQEVLEALPDMTPQEVSAALADREKDPFTLGDISNATNNNTGGMGGGVANHAFTVLVKASVGQGSFTRRAVVGLTGDPQIPYQVMDWTVE